MMRIALSTVTAYLPHEAVRGRSSRELLERVRAASLVVLAAPDAANDGSTPWPRDTHGGWSVTVR